MPASLDLFSYYGWMVLGVLTACWGWTFIHFCGAPRRRLTALVVVSVLTAALAGVMIHHDRWGAGASIRAEYERKCAELRERYIAAETVVELQRSRDALQESLCRIHTGPRA